VEEEKQAAGDFRGRGDRPSGIVTELHTYRLADRREATARGRERLRA